MLAILFLLIGLFILIKSGEATVKYSINFARIIGISELAVGFVLIAIATSVPELAVAVMSSLANEGLISLGNIFGSNIADIALIFGILAFITRFEFKKDDIKESIKIIGIASLITIPLIFLDRIWWAYGFICLVVFIFLSYSMLKNSYRLEEKAPEFEGIKTLEIVKIIFKALFALVFVVLSSKLVIDSSIELIQVFGLAESFIGATVIAIGTSLPELSVALSAIRNGRIGLAIGDVIGSVITNITLVLGFTIIFNPIFLGEIARTIIISSLVINMIFLFLLGRKFDKITGSILLGSYLLFLIILFFSQF